MNTSIGHIPITLCALDGTDHLVLYKIAIYAHPAVYNSEIQWWKCCKGVTGSPAIKIMLLTPQIHFCLMEENVNFVPVDLSKVEIFSSPLPKWREVLILIAQFAPNDSQVLIEVLPKLSPICEVNWKILFSEVLVRRILDILKCLKKNSK